MKTQTRLLSLLFLSTALCLSSCEKEAEFKNVLVKEEKANIETNTGFTDREVKMSSGSWKVVYVKNINPTHYLLDGGLQLMRLGSFGRVDCSLGFISLEKKSSDPDKLFISMTENLSNDPRRILIGIEDENSAREVEITQQKGNEYEWVKTEVKENTAARKIWKQKLPAVAIDNKATTPLTLTTPVKEFYKEAAFISDFTSDYYGTFDWAPDTLIGMAPFIYQGIKYWDAKVKYVKGKQTTAFMADATQPVNVVTPANSKRSVFAEVTFISRECDYTITLKNKTTGFLATLVGRWKQTVPIKGEIKSL